LASIIQYESNAGRNRLQTEPGEIDGLHRRTLIRSSQLREISENLRVEQRCKRAILYLRLKLQERSPERDRSIWKHDGNVERALRAYLRGF